MRGCKYTIIAIDDCKLRKVFISLEVPLEAIQVELGGFT